MDVDISLVMFSHAASLVGAVLILLAYYFLSSGAITAKSPIYQILNLVGVLGIGLEVLLAGAWASLFLNFSWGVIALFALVQIWRSRSLDKEENSR